MVRPRCSWSAALALVACGPDAPDLAEHGRVCGQQGPVRILELAGDRPLARMSSWDFAEEGRRLLSAGYLDPTPEPSFFGVSPSTDGFDLWSVGTCGEDPRLVLEDHGSLRTFAPWPDVVLECVDDVGEWATVDPTGERPRNVVMAGDVDCHSRTTAHGWIRAVPNEDETLTLVLVAFPDDPWTQTATEETVLIEGVSPRLVNTEGFVVFDDEVLARTLDDDLVHVSLPDGTVTVDASGVRGFAMSYDGNWALWQAQVPSDDERVASEVYLLDRSTGTSTYVAHASLEDSFSALDLIDQGYVHLAIGFPPLSESQERFFRLSDFSSFDLEGRGLHASVLADGRWLVYNLFDGGAPYDLYDPQTGERRTLIDEPGRVYPVDDGVRFHELVNAFDWSAEGPLWHVSFEGERRLLAERVLFWHTFLDDGRLLTAVDPHDWKGDLVLVDPEDRGESVLDRDVAVTSYRLEEDGTILYAVSDGERTGVWLTRPAALGE